MSETGSPRQWLAKIRPIGTVRVEYVIRLMFLDHRGESAGISGRRRLAMVWGIAEYPPFPNCAKFLSPKAIFVMTRSIAVSVALVLVGLVSSVSLRAGDLLPPHIAAQLGLTESWRRYVQVPAGAQSIADQQIFVHQVDPREYVEITVPLPADSLAVADGTSPATKVLVRIATDRVGVDGKEIGKKEAERLATNEIRRLKRRGIDATMSWRSVPRIHLYTLSDDGTLECRDAETGEPVWLSRVGTRGLNYGALGISDEHISVINGANLIQVDSSNGEVIEEVATVGTPLHGAIHAGRYAMVPTIHSGVEGYPMDDPTLDPFMETVAGISLARPSKSPDSTRVAWGTDQGFVYVMELSGEPSVLFRLRTDGIVSGRIASASGDRFFFGSESGQVYGLRATRSGEVMWSKPFGDPFYNGPMIAGDQLLLRSTYGNLYSLDLETGLGTWDSTAPNVDELIGVIGDQIFIRTLSGSFSVLNRETGKRIATFNEVQPTKLLSNTLTDRLYMISDSGAVQCLRPIGAEMPTINMQIESAPKVEEKPEAAAAKTPTTPFEPAAKDPFAAGADPFGAGDAADPFGAGGAADPFGGGERHGRSIRSRSVRKLVGPRHHRSHFACNG